MFSRCSITVIIFSIYMSGIIAPLPSYAQADVSSVQSVHWASPHLTAGLPEADSAVQATRTSWILYTSNSNRQERSVNQRKIVKTICSILDNIRPKTDGSKYGSQITFVKDHQNTTGVMPSTLQR